MTRFHKALSVLAGCVLLLSPLSGQEAKAPEPDVVNVVFHFDRGRNTLQEMERQTAKMATRTRAFGLGGTKAVVAEISGKRAPLRLRVGEPMEFVVQLPSGIDPAKFQLFRFEAKGDKRIVVLANAGLASVSAPGSLQVSAGRHGGSSYKLVPAGDLSPGEYGFSASDSSDAFCFGVDALSQELQR